MGVDVELWAVLPRVLSEAEVNRVAVDMQVKLGTRMLRTEPGSLPYRSSHHCLEIMPETWNRRDVPAGRTYVRVITWESYYGPGYERGDLHEILAVARYLRSMWRDAKIHYGGDNDNDLPVLDDELETALWAHFTSTRGRAYFTDQRRSADGHEYWNTNVHCDHCDLTCINNMGGGDRAGWYCPSCGRHWLRTKTDLVACDRNYKGAFTTTEPTVPRGDIMLPRERLRAIVRQFENGSDPRHALIELSMLIDEVERAE